MVLCQGEGNSIYSYKSDSSHTARRRQHGSRHEYSTSLTVLGAWDWLEGPSPVAGERCEGLVSGGPGCRSAAARIEARNDCTRQLRSKHILS